MHDSVRAAWRLWNTPFEGVVYWMYLDTHNPPLVTTGMGNMIDPVELALGLPWQWGASGAFASTDSIATEWRAVKADATLSQRGARAAEAGTLLRLPDAAVDALIGQKLDQFEMELKLHPAFAAFETWPADAQLALLSMAWAMGPGFGGGWPHFTASCAALDFETASMQCGMGGSPPPAARNRATARAFEWAAQVVSTKADPSVLLTPIPG